MRSVNRMISDLPSTHFIVIEQKSIQYRPVDYLVRIAMLDIPLLYSLCEPLFPEFRHPHRHRNLSLHVEVVVALMCFWKSSSLLYVIDSCAHARPVDRPLWVIPVYFDN